VNQVGEVAAAVKTQMQTNWPFICIAVGIVARELKNFNLWVRSVAEYIMGHGGWLMILWKLTWNRNATLVSVGIRAVDFSDLKSEMTNFKSDSLFTAWRPPPPPPAPNCKLPASTPVANSQLPTTTP